MRLISVLLITSLIFASFEDEIDQQFVITSKSDNVTTISFILPDSTFERNNHFSKINPDHISRTTDTGNPDFPVYSKMFLAESGKSYEFDVIIKRSHQLNNITPQPAKSLEDPDLLDLNSFDYLDRTGTYPQQNLKTSLPMKMRGNKIIQFSFVPYKYFFDTQILEVIDEAEIKITESNVPDLDSDTQRLRSRAIEPLLSSMVINYLPGDDDEYQQPAILYICGGNASSNPYFQELVQWRRQQGYIVYTANINEIGNQTSNIKNYLQTAYDTFTPPPEFIALVGDTGSAYDIPTFYENWSTCSYNEPCNGEGDFPYSQLDGDDLLPDVLIGRLSIRNSTSLSIVCNKTINYEKGLNAGVGWYESASLGANPEIYGNGLSIVITNEYISELLQESGYEDVTLNVQPNMAAMSYWLNNQLNVGVSYLNFRGLYGPASFDINIIMNDLTSHTMLPFVTFITCGTGSFSYEGSSPIEQFLRSGTSPSNYSGGVAAIGTATYGTHTPFNNIVDMGIYHGIFSLGVETAGGALAAGELALLNTYPDNPSNYVSIFTHWNNLMGDPALKLWTDTPDLLDVQHTQNLMPGTDNFTVTVSNAEGIPIEGAVVNLLIDGSVLAVQKFTDEQGIAFIPISENMTGSAKVTVLKKNYIPYQNDILINQSGPGIELAAPVYIDDTVDGNGDGILNPGETAQFTALFDVSGGDIPSGGTISITGEFTDITDGICNFPPTINGETITCTFGVHLSPEINQNLDFQMIAYIIDGASNNWEILIPVPISGCLLQFTEIQSFNPLNFYPGTEMELNLSMENIGSAESGIISGHISSPNDHEISIISSEIMFESIEPGMEGESIIDPIIQIHDYAIWGSIVDLVMDFETDSGSLFQLTLPITLDEGTIAEPVGPDSYGYYIYGEEDRYNLTPQYFWMEIDPYYGGDGIPQQMIDCGVGEPYEQYPSIIDLPFIFQFYGEEYSTISVSTNGWISFGITDQESFRNTPVPGPGGPSPMIAVFWDDLKTIGENGSCYGQPYGDVYYFEDPDNRYVIVEWSDVKTVQNDDPESFQIILYNTGELTLSGDDEIQLQYKIFNNSTSGLYLPGYNGLLHGAYATIGIEDQSEAAGLQYTFNNEWDTFAYPLQTESSLFITTRYPQNLFFADSTIGTPPFTVTFEAVETGEGIVHEWDLNNDGILDTEGDVIQWTYEDFGHYTVRMFQTENDDVKSEYRLNYINVAILGCTDQIAENYNPSAEINDGSCMYIYGCMDPTAANYNESATMDSENCFYMPYEEFEVPGIYFNAYFGSDVVLEGDIAVVGAFNDSTGGIMSTGAAYIFKQNPEGVWDLITKLTAYDSAMMDYYGFSVDISGNRVAVGSYQDDNEYGVNVGAVYIYKETMTGQWELEDKIIPEDGEQSDNFGYDVKLSGNMLVSTARKDDINGNSNQGSVYAYEFSEVDGWTFSQFITPEDGDAGDSFGRALSMNDQYLISSSPLADVDDFANTGKVYLYENDGSTSWNLLSAITPIDLQAQDQFGSSVVVSGEYVIIGSPNDDVGDLQNSGSVYIYRNYNGAWIFDDLVTDEFAEDNDNFGKNIDMEGDYLSIHSGNKLMIYHREINGEWQKSSVYETPVAGPMSINQNRILSGNMNSNSARIYLLDEWEDWLNDVTQGDINNDNVLDVLDVVMVVGYIMGNIELSTDQQFSAELSGDGIVDILDIIILVDLIL